MRKKLKPWPFLTVVGLGTTLMLACTHGRGGPMVAVPAERSAPTGEVRLAPPGTSPGVPAQPPEAAAPPPTAEEAQAAAIAPAAAAGLAPAVMPLAQAELFTSKDTNGDGVLSIDEFTLGLAPITPDEAAAMFTALDQNRDSRIVVAEYFPDPATVQAHSEGVNPADQPTN